MSAFLMFSYSIPIICVGLIQSDLKKNVWNTGELLESDEDALEFCDRLTVGYGWYLSFK